MTKSIFIDHSSPLTPQPRPVGEAAEATPCKRLPYQADFVKPAVAWKNATPFRTGWAMRRGPTSPSRQRPFSPSQVCLGSKLDHRQTASAVARVTPEQKLAASLS